MPQVKKGRKPLFDALEQRDSTEQTLKDIRDDVRGRLAEHLRVFPEFTGLSDEHLDELTLQVMTVVEDQHRRVKEQERYEVQRRAEVAADEARAAKEQSEVDSPVERDLAEERAAASPSPGAPEEATT